MKAWIGALALLWAWGARADELNVLLSQGEVVHIEEPDASGRQFVTGMVLINAPIEKVWDVITDFDRYDEFMPQANGIRIIKKDGDSWDVDYNLRFKFSVISTKVHYVLRHRLRKPTEAVASEITGDIKDVHACWELRPSPDGKATIASYRHYSDLTSLGSLMKFFLKEQPQLGTAVQVSTAALVVKAVKARVEAPSSSRTRSSSHR